MSSSHKPISLWAAIVWAAAIDVVLCVLGADGPLAGLFQQPMVFITVLLLVPLVLLFAVSICNSPKYKRPD